ncbi:hypothetical protein [Lactobacillus porci]|uniref:hypothetical protein n=1 Tax=Lactobacillus porci TaxID=2012477 RepID=UPI0012B430E3|nr:hypothetical protein [Lactobacillus porci]
MHNLELLLSILKEVKSHPTLADVSDNLYLSQSYVSQLSHELSMITGSSWSTAPACQFL